MFNSDKRRKPVVRGEVARAKVPPADIGRKRRWLAGASGQLLLGLLTTALVTALLGSRGAPFRYRLGQYVDREIRLKVNLSLPNETKTRSRREDAVLGSPLAFIHDPQKNEPLQARILELVSVLSRQADFERLEPRLVDEWKLTADLFATLRSLVPDESALAQFQQDFKDVMQPIHTFGVLDDAALPADKMTTRTTNLIEIFPIGADEKFYRTKIYEEVLLSRLQRPDGPLALSLKKKWPNEKQANAVLQLLVGPGRAPGWSLSPSLQYDKERTLKNEIRRRDAVEEAIDAFAAGTAVVAAGERISADQLQLLRAEHEAVQRIWAQTTPWYRKLAHYLGLGAIVLALVATSGYYLQAYEPRLFQSPARLAVLCLVVLATIGLAQLLGIEPYHAEILPIAASSLLVAVAYNRILALMLTLGFAVLTALTEAEPMDHFIVVLGGTSVGVLVLENVRSRTKLITVGFYTALAYAAMSVALDLMTEQPWQLVAQDAARRAACGLIAGFVISGCLPFIEALFGIVTDISLIELADTSHPLLQELVRRAPGTYNHSVTVSIIAESAAQCIGANSLLVRVGALFHDIGKMLKPHYFIENMSENDKNRHDRLVPAMSTLIIIGHVKDGIDLARQHHLPQPIIDMIEQHHGTTLIDYFYHEATRGYQRTADPEETVEESAYRYPGPKPQTKEVAVLMLSDCVESASRTLSEPTPARIEKLVRTMSLNRLLDSQFSDSGITLHELKLVEESLIKSLTSVYHGRIRYPAAV